MKPIVKIAATAKFGILASLIVLLLVGNSGTKLRGGVYQTLGSRGRLGKRMALHPEYISHHDRQKVHWPEFARYEPFWS